MRHSAALCERARNQRAVKALKTNDSAKSLISHPNDFNDLRPPSRNRSFRWRNISFRFRCFRASSALERNGPGALLAMTIRRRPGTRRLKVAVRKSRAAAQAEHRTGWPHEPHPEWDTCGAVAQLGGFAAAEASFEGPLGRPGGQRLGVAAARKSAAKALKCLVRVNLCAARSEAIGAGSARVHGEDELPATWREARRCSIAPASPKGNVCSSGTLQAPVHDPAHDRVDRLAPELGRKVGVAEVKAREGERLRDQSFPEIGKGP